MIDPRSPRHAVGRQRDRHPQTAQIAAFRRSTLIVAAGLILSMLGDQTDWAPTRMIGVAMVFVGCLLAADVVEDFRRG